MTTTGVDRAAMKRELALREQAHRRMLYALSAAIKARDTTRATSIVKSFIVGNPDYDPGPTL